MYDSVMIWCPPKSTGLMEQLLDRFPDKEFPSSMVKGYFQDIPVVTTTPGLAPENVRHCLSQSKWGIMSILGKNDEGYHMQSQLEMSPCGVPVTGAGCHAICQGEVLFS